MRINVDYQSAAKRRLIIALTIIPFTVFVAADVGSKAIRWSVGNLWRGAAAAWRK